jgi:hypothetical protein
VIRESGRCAPHFGAASLPVRVRCLPISSLAGPALAPHESRNACARRCWLYFLATRGSGSASRRPADDGSRRHGSGFSCRPQQVSAPAEICHRRSLRARRGRRVPPPVPTAPTFPDYSQAKRVQRDRRRATPSGGARPGLVRAVRPLHDRGIRRCKKRQRCLESLL